MIIELDAKQLEWVAACYLSRDPVGLSEILEGVDTHAKNQERFKLPERHFAKIFLFRLIYGGTAFAYASDPDFMDVSKSEKFWQRVIDEAYEKYQGLNKWHTKLVQEVSKSGGELLVPCTGRMYNFTKEYGEWPRPKILNYPVQGLGHDLMAMLRSCLWRYRRTLSEVSSKFISTVHDSVIFDCPKASVELTLSVIKQAAGEVPLDFERRFGVQFDLPFRIEVKVGPDWGKLEEVKL